MNGNAPEKQPAVRPGLLIVVLLALGGTLYWRFFMQPKPLPSAPTTPAPVITPMDNSVNTSQPKKQDAKVGWETTSNRDLFLPPPPVIAARRNKDNEVSPSNQPVWNEPRLIKPEQEISSSVKIDENSEKPILKGIIGTANTQVVIVRYQNKSFLLKLGDVLPSSEYRVTEVSNDTVLLTSPKGRLKLTKKERAK